METIKENKSNVVVFIPFTAVKRFFILDLTIGTAAFYGCKAIYDHVLIDSIGTMAVTEVIKKIQKYLAEFK
ncbi:hypothetical protein [Niallia sp. NCCP-28]|uniref:hypothetical protein n=1 Tax=Niallia sp. NCCP-28 TaxID=2934712 RepID=UPI002089D148|nr:hypothetical protein [Niallia sp. NCCP-28]GKU83361.1 hypothetical protein NCCP28_27570 [Niallia sp. NCCP-28]